VLEGGVVVDNLTGLGADHVHSSGDRINGASPQHEMVSGMALSAVFAAAIQHSPNGVAVSDARLPDNPLIFVNPAFCAMSGYAVEECTGRNCRFLQGPDTNRDVVLAMRNAINSGKSFRGRLLNYHKNGTTWWNEVAVDPVFDEDGQLIYFVGLQRDVTQRVRAETELRVSEHRYRLLCDNSTDMIARHAPDTRYLDVSPACRDLLGCSPAELLGRTPCEFFHPDDTEKMHCAHQRVLAGETMAPIEYRVRHADGSWRWVETSARRLCDDQNSSHVADSREIITVTRDIGERRQIEEERERLLFSEQGARADAEDTVARLQALQTISDIALVNLDSDALLTEFMSRIRRAVGGDESSLLLLSEDKQSLTLCASDGLDDLDSSEVASIAIGEGVIGQIAQTHQPICVPDLTHVIAPSLFHLSPIRALIGAPLLVDGRLIGVLHVGSLRADCFSHKDLQLLQLVADRAATAIERGRLFEQVRVGNEQLHALSRRLLAAQEDERRHIARELHDEIGQVLTAVKINLQSVQGVGELCCEPARSGDLTMRLDECVSVVENAIHQVRHLSVSLRPPVLDVLGLVAALREYSDRLAQRAGFTAHISADTLRQRPSLEVETACFRVAQEALTNIVRHAQAAQVEITLRVRQGYLHLLIRDNGVGFNLEEATERAINGDNMGLAGMEERARLAGGEFKIHSRPGFGTQLHASFALDSSLANGSSTRLVQNATSMEGNFARNN
jgi:PAS domain S-box-containing protein